MAVQANALEGRGGSRPARYLRAHRFKLALWIAAIEGFLVFVHVIPHLVMYVLAVVAVGLGVTVARRYRSAMARNASWIFASSQALAVLIPVVLFFAEWAAGAAIAVLAVIALVILLAERKRA
jgi:hypothetical protein